jgi:hypothetical protein
MATMIVRFQVQDFDRWKAVFDGMDRVRRDHAITAASVHRNAADRDVVVTILHADTMDAAKAWGNSDVLRDAMSRAGIDDVIEVEYLEDVE